MPKNHLSVRTARFARRLGTLAGAALLLGLPFWGAGQTLQHRYSFNGNAHDSAGSANGTVVGNAYITNNSLVLPGGGNSANPSGYVSLPNGIVSNDTSITVEAWLTDTGSLTWAEVWCFGNTAAGPGQPPSSGTAYISLIPRSGGNDFRAAFNLTGTDEIDIVDNARPLPVNTLEYAVVTYDAASTTGSLYLNGTLVGTASIPTNLAPANYGNTYNNWLGRDEWGGDPMFQGTLQELRIWNAAQSPLYISLSQQAGSDTLITNLTPVSLVVTASLTNLAVNQSEQATVVANFRQVTNVDITTSVTNWTSSNPNILAVNNNGLVTAVGSGIATISATFGGLSSTSAPVSVTAPLTGSITVAYWQFLNSTNFLQDSSGLGYQLAVASGTPTYSSNGLFGGALYLDGNSTLTTASGQFPTSLPTGANPFTIAVWEKVDAGCPNNGGFIGWGVNATSDCNNFRLGDLYGNSDALDDYWYNNDFFVDGLANNPADGNWHALIVTWDGTNETFYVDGANVGSRQPAPPNVQPANFVIGRTTSDVNFKGWMEDLLVANAAFTDADAAVYQAGGWSPALTVYPLPPTASPSNTVFAGTTVTLNVVVAGNPPFQYQWQKNGTNISSGTNLSLVLTNALMPDSGTYSVIVANAIGTNASAGLVVTINPPSAPVFAQQPMPANSTNYQGSLVTFSTSLIGSQPIQLQWQHNGVNILNANWTSLTLASLQLAEAGSYTVIASNSHGNVTSAVAQLTVLPAPNPSSLNVLTYHYDNTRQGANTNEVILTPASVNTNTFGKLLSYTTDGYIIAQPLYVYGLNIPGKGTHNTVFVATENNTLYAFDADSNAGTNGGLLWQTNLGVAPSSYTGEFGTRYQGTYYGDIVPVVGITGTPVISLTNGTLYVSVHTREVAANKTNYFHRIHAINITNGTEQSYSPVVVSNSMAGTGVESTNGIVGFNPRQENERPGLTLANGMLYVAYGSYEDTDPYHGWIFGFNMSNLSYTPAWVFNTTPNATKAAFGANAGEGALWMGGSGLCVDASNNLFFATANGSFSAQTNGGDYGDAFVKLSTTNNGLHVADYFAPYNQASLASADLDLGSGGVVLLPDSVGSAAHPHLMVGAGKAGAIHLVDRDNLGQFNAANDNQIVQEINGAVGAVRSTPAYFNNQIYYQGNGDVMRAFYITNAAITPTPISTSHVSIGAPGGTPVVTASGTKNGIVWVVSPDAYGSSGPAVLHAFAATNLGVELYNSSQNLGRDNPGGAIRMTTPTVINGKVLVGGQYTLAIFGNSLFLSTPLITPGSGSFTNSVTVSMSDATPNSTIYYTLDGTAPTTNSTVYTGLFVLTTSAAVQAIAAQPGTPNSAIAVANLVDTAAVGNGTGLQGSYWSNVTAQAFTNINFSIPPTLVRTDAVVNFNWTSTPPAPSIGRSNFVVRWTGCVQPEYGETYTFSTYAAGGVRLWINGQLLINQWTNQVATAYSNTIRLVPQQLYNIQLDYFNQGGGAQAELSWSSPSTPNAIIPTTQLYPYTNPPPAVVLTTPTNNTPFTAQASVTISADADAQYNPLSYVSFFTNGGYVGSVSNVSYTLTMTGVPAGSYTITATAMDGSGLTATSAPVAITVTAGSGKPYGLTSNAPIGAFLNGALPGSAGGTLPAVLSATGAFADTPNRTPAGGLIPYGPNTPLWSDNAVKSRYIAVPNSGGLISPSQQIGFASTGSWTFPSGTVFVKNFDLVVDETNPAVPLRRLETRLLVRDTNGAVYGYTYKWRPDNSDADLLPGSLTETVYITNASGVRSQNWYYPSPSDCLTCHTPVAGYVLGVNTRQLNGSNTYVTTGITDNQLRTFNRLGLFNPAINEASISNYAQMVSVTNTSAPLVTRVRSYLDANCAQCHQPGGTGITFDARFDTPILSQNILNAPAAFSLGYDNVKIIAPSDVWRSSIYLRMNTTNNAIKMPNLARNLIDTNAVATLTAWINSLGGLPTLPPPTLSPSPGTYQGYVTVSATNNAITGTLRYTLDGSLPTTNSAVYNGPILLASNATVNVNAWASGYVNSVVASGVFTIQPGIFFYPNVQWSNNSFQGTFSGPPGKSYILQASTNLTGWTSIRTSTPATSPFILTDPGASNPQRFYRVLQSP